MWSVVHFLKEDNVEVVPASWVKNNSVCFWPNIKSPSVISKMIDKSVAPAGDWLEYDIRILGNGYNDIKLAREKCARAENYSDLNSDNDGKRKILRRQYSSDEEDVEVRRRKVFIRDESDNDSDEGPHRHKLVKPYPARPPLHEASGSLESKYNKSKCCCNSSENAAFRNHVMKELSVLKLFQRSTTSQLEELVQLMQSYKAPSTEMSTAYTTEFESKFPITKIDDLEVIEVMLQCEEKMNILLNELVLIGGNSSSEMVRRIMCTVINNEVASEFNWFGRGSKRGFSMFKLSQIIIKSVRQKFPATSLKHVEDCIKNWLRHAPVRALKGNRHLDSVLTP